MEQRELDIYKAFLEAYKLQNQCVLTSKVIPIKRKRSKKFVSVLDEVRTIDVSTKHS